MSVERLAAALSDRYRIERELGQGGMATVYLAQDLRHDRQVAIKVLRPELAAVLGAERFVVEIKTTAALQHPHILPLFDSGEADGFLFYVMPYIEGETLRTRLDREKQLGIQEAVKITTEVADALDYAHRHGVIHRDIKPENILLHDGRPMVADFGIALALSAAAGGRMTETGMSLGTPHYMSPEQATAEKEITGRSDIYSLASVLYEMLAGQPPHLGGSAQQIIMKIIAEPVPAVTSLRKSVPPNVAAALMKALEKLPADRFDSAKAFADALTNASFTTLSTAAGTAVGAPASRRPRLLVAAAAVVVVAALGFGWALRGWLQQPAPAAPVRFAFELGDPSFATPLPAISPDGRRIVMGVQDSAGVTHLVERDLGSTTLRTIPGTDGGYYPSYSPDGAWLAYSTLTGNWRIPVEGGTRSVIVDSSQGNSPGWLPDGSFVVPGSRGLLRVPPSGGSPQPLTRIDTARHEFRHWGPRALPGGREVLFTAYATPVTKTRIEAVDLRSHKLTVLVENGMSPRYVAPGYLLFVRDQTIFAVKFDPSALEVSGTPTPVQEDVHQAVDEGYGSYDVSPNGTLVYVSAAAWNVPREVVWVDRAGHPSRALADTGSWAEPRLSPDGRWIALTQVTPRKTLMLYDVRREVLSGLVHAPGVTFNAVWMPDSRHLIYDFETPQYDLHMVAVDGTGDTAVVSTPVDKYAGSVSSDGRLVAYAETPGNQVARILIARTDGSGTPRPLDPDANGMERMPAISPDGRWVAYQANSRGRDEIFLRTASGAGGRRQISLDGGTEPRWTRGGRELLYRRGTAMMAVPIDPATGDAGTPAELFDEPGWSAGSSTWDVSYDVTPDGNRFLMVRTVKRSSILNTVVVLNWFTELQEKMKR